MKNSPPEIFAISFIESSSTGTDCCRPSMSTTPSSVPNEIVEIGVPAFLASSAASKALRVPTVSLPSVISTMRAGGGPSAPPTTLPNESIDAIAATSASPVAVDWASFSPSIDCVTAARSVVGATSTVAEPAKEISPRLMPGVRPSANDLAATCAASRRDGFTSVAFIDSDTSTTSITVARLRGTRCSDVGPASATVSNASAARRNAAGTWRDQRSRLGATFSSSSRFVNRSTRLRRICCAATYPEVSAATPISRKKNPGATKFVKLTRHPQTSGACAPPRNEPCPRSSRSRSAAPGARPPPGADPRPPRPGVPRPPR